MGIFRKKPKTVTLNHYIIKFKTTDGEVHTYSHMKYCNENAITCGALEYYLESYKDRLMDDEGTLYPINNIISISAVMDNYIDNVIEKDCFSGWSQVWYSKSDIEVYKGA